MPTYVSPFTGTVVQQTDVTYFELNFSTNTSLHWPAQVNPPEIPAARIMDCTAANPNLSIILPPADQGSTGTDIFIRNLGANAFFVKDYTGNVTATVGVGEVKYYYLADNSTPAGVWNNIEFGAGTSSADAATLAGPGLAAIAGKLAVTDEIFEVSTTPTLTEADRAKTYVWTGGNGSLILPTGSTLNSGWFIAFRNGGNGNLIIQGSGGEQINSTGSITTAPGNSGYIIFKQDTNEFFTVGLSTPTNVSLTSATYDVDAIVGNTFSLVTFAPVIQTYTAPSGTRTQTLLVELPGTAQVYTILNSTGTVAYDVTFKVSGSPQVPVAIPNGTAATVLSVGSYLYVLTQVAVNNFYGQNGSAGAPPFTFTNDPTSGMYLIGVGNLAFSANGIEMLNIDNTDTMNPLISTPGQFNAALIAGGTF